MIQAVQLMQISHVAGQVVGVGWKLVPWYWGLPYQPLMTDEYEALLKKQNYRQNPVTIHLCPAQFPHGLPWEWTQDLQGDSWSLEAIITQYRFSFSWRSACWHPSAPWPQGWASVSLPSPYRKCWRGTVPTTWTSTRPLGSVRRHVHLANMACGSRHSFAHMYLLPVSASVASIATPLGCLLCGPLLDQFGRRIALLALNVPFALGWLTLAVTPSPVYTPLLYIGRILTGIGTFKAVVLPTWDTLACMNLHLSGVPAWFRRGSGRMNGRNSHPASSILAGGYQEWWIL